MPPPESDLRSRAEHAFHEWLALSRAGGAPTRDELLAAQPAEVVPELERLLGDYEELRREITQSSSRFEEGRVIGEFRLIRELGRGGMGVVWEAEQVPIRRRVALKCLFPHHGLSERTLARFRREAEAGGRLAHQGIVQVHAVGEADGVHYLAQELVAGGYTLADSLSDLRAETELPEGYYRRAAELFVKVAEALAHAHSLGVIHRDVKPSNILIAESDQPKLADFGMAHVEDQLSLSRTGEFMGTPYYMSPEQAASRRMGIDHRTDIFSLGATLYEALALVRPFDGDTSQQVFQKILTEDPPDPRTRRSRVPGDLAVIALKAMEKSPERRFASMSAFAEDLRRFLRDEPIRARPPGVVRRVRKWMIRHPTWSAVTALGAAAFVVITWLLVDNLRQSRMVQDSNQLLESANTDLYSTIDQLRTARDEALKNAKLAAESAEESRWQRDYLDNVRTAAYDIERGNMSEARRRLTACPADQRGWEWRHLSLRRDQSLLVLSTPGAEGEGDVSEVLVSPDGTLVVTRDLAGLHLITRDATRDLARPHLFDAVTGAELPTAAAGQTRAAKLAFLDDGRLLAAGSRRETVFVWDQRDGVTLAELRGHTETVSELCFSGDGRRLAAGTADGAVRVFDTLSGAELAAFPGDRRKVLSIALDRRGERVAWGSTDGTVRVRDVASKQELAALGGHGRRVTAIVLAPDGRSLVSEAADDTVRVWALGREEPLVVLEGHDLRSFPVAFADDGSAVFSACQGGTIQGWDTETGRQLCSFGPEPYASHSLALSPDGTLLAAGGSDQNVHVWRVPTGERVSRLSGHEGPVRAVVFASGGERVVSGAGDGSARVWDVRAAGEVGTLAKHTSAPSVSETPVNPVVIAPDGAWIASGERERTAWSQAGRGIRVWDARSGDLMVELRGHEKQVTALAAAPSSRTLVSGSLDGTVRVWDVAEGKSLWTLPGHGKPVFSVAVTPEGGRIVSGGADRTVRVWDLVQPERGSRVFELESVVGAVAVDRSGERIFAGTDDGKIHVLDVLSGEELLLLEGHTGPVVSLAPSPDGLRLASGGGDQTIRIFDLAQGASLLVMRAPRRRSGTDLPPTAYSVAYSPDGTRIASGSKDGVVRVWHAARGDELAMLHDDEDERSVLWDPRTGLPRVSRLPNQPSQSPCFAVAFSADGARIVSAEDDGSVRIWESDIEQARAFWHGQALWTEAEGLVATLFDAGFAYPDVLDFLGHDSDLSEEQRAAAGNAAKWRQQRGLEGNPAPLVSALFRQKPLAERVIREIESDPALSTEERRAAIARVRRRGAPEAFGLYLASSWIGRRSEASLQDYGRALRWAELAAELEPDRPSYVSNLGIALYRSGDCAAALATLARAEQLNRARSFPDQSLVQDLACLAMARWKLGEREAARELLSTARRHAAEPDSARDALAQGFLREAEALMPSGE